MFQSIYYLDNHVRPIKLNKKIIFFYQETNKKYPFNSLNGIHIVYVVKGLTDQFIKCVQQVEYLQPNRTHL